MAVTKAAQSCLDHSRYLGVGADVYADALRPRAQAAGPGPSEGFDKPASGREDWWRTSIKVNAKVRCFEIIDTFFLSFKFSKI